MVITKELNSKVRVVMEQIPYVQSVAIGIWVKAGAVDEEAKYAGISHFIEHMMFKGTENRTAKQIAADIDKIGGQINAFTGKEATCYYVKAIYSNYKQAADVIVDMLSSSLFDKAEMDRECQVICEEIKMTQDAPDDLAHDTITSMVFKGSALGNSIIGTPASLENISRDVIKDYFNSEYTRDHIVISVAGNFEPDDVCAYFDDKLTGLKESKPEKESTVSVYTPAYKVITKDIEQSHICLAVKGLPLNDSRYYAFSILNNILGGSMSSRLFQNIREQKGLAYSVYSMAGSFKNDGYFNIYAGVSHDKIKEAIGGIREELAEIAAHGVTEEELESSREQLKASYIFGQENVAGHMFKNGKNLLLGNPILTGEEVIAGFNAVTIDDIESVKSLICDFETYSAAAVTRDEVNLKGFMGR
ncbi:pitrilysin family protein [Emergencia sp. 1XD21-10]|uniref:M16 family metallopeptidase n=1 Tax=Emergencia sp. 1XD21-10 TaxID=2304569 RepID=UPI0013793C7C|nr:pitrilysin family protein [Emergencia sp. 1XD21-10]NCE98918.1 insulinase family protein [Emergencia sp. 1XD21-10]